MGLQAFECLKCGATRFREADGLLHCEYCRATYRRLGPEPHPDPDVDPVPKLRIGRGAKVVVGKTARVRIGGRVVIEEGASVEVHGDVELVDAGDGKG